MLLLQGLGLQLTEQTQHFQLRVIKITCSRPYRSASNSPQHLKFQ